ncbi:anti-restriction protein [Escherichia coli]|uniref:Anti-restriction protein n=1 Tax=Escherichia coli TaxID=562 RepID=A0A376KWA7_ECOLX|nr:anti-restriction protein [Escherichia coli]
MAPEPDDDDDENWVLFNAMNGNRAEMSPEAAGIAACLMTYSHQCLSYGVLRHDSPLLPSAGLRPAASGMQRYYAHHRLNGGRDNATAFLSARRDDAR